MSVGREFLGFGVEIKPYDGHANESELQIYPWCATYLNWMHQRGQKDVPLPPILGCSIVGIRVDFFIAFGIVNPRPTRWK